MTIRFFVLQAHYRSTLDFSNEGLKAAEKGMKKLFNAKALLNKLKTEEKSTSDIAAVKQACYSAMNDDMNSAMVIAELFEAVRIINSVHAGIETISKFDLEELQKFFPIFIENILGLKEENAVGDNGLEGLMQIILGVRSSAKANRDFATSDKIRDELAALGFKIKDEKEGTSWVKE